MTERFKLETHDLSVPGIDEFPSYWLNISVHDTDRELHRAMAKHAGVPLASIGENVGGCFSYPDGRPTNRYLGILRFSKENLTANTIIHESVHVAVHLARVHFRCNPLRLPRGGHGLREEVVAYATAPLAEALIDMLITDRQ